MTTLDDLLRINRRHFFKTGAAGIGSLALSAMLGRAFGASSTSSATHLVPHFAPKAKRVIFLFQAVDPPSTSCSITNRCCVRKTARKFQPTSSATSA